MTVKKFVYKTIIKTLLYTILSMLAIFLFTHKISDIPVPPGQIPYDHWIFMFSEFYYVARPFVSFIYNCITVLFIGSIIYDTRKLIKAKKEKCKNCNCINEQ